MQCGKHVYVYDGTRQQKTMSIRKGEVNVDARQDLSNQASYHLSNGRNTNYEIRHDDGIESIH